MASENTSRNLNDLRVSDLREELERRGLDKSGVKSVLIKRLQQALSESSESLEGDFASEGKEIAMEKNQGDFVEGEEITDIDPEDVDPDDMVVKDELDASIDDNEANESAEKEEDEEESNITVSTNHYELKKLEVKVEDCASKIRPGPACSKINQSLVVKSKAVINNIEIKTDQNQAEQEDSINLTIGEDEEKLLQEADDGHLRSKASDVKQQPKSSTNNIKQQQSGIKSSSKEESSEDKSAVVSVAEKQEESTSVIGAEKKTEDDASATKSQQAEAISSSSSPTKSVSKEDKDSTKKSGASSTSRNLWVSGLDTSTRATDLKQVFSKYGKVIGAKVVTNARTPGARCYGYVTMASNEDATRCIHNLHRTELHGRMVSVERAKSDGAVPAKKDSAKADAEQSSKNERSEKSSLKLNDDKSVETGGISNGAEPPSEGANEKSDKKSDRVDDKKAKSESKSISKDKDRSDSRKSRSKLNSKSRDRERSPKGGRRHKSNTSKERKQQVLSFEQIRAEREKQRLRDRERALREEERKRREEQQRNREVERWQREEAARLAREREKLQREREKIERERVEILKLERTRQKLERERLEFERMELKRQQLKIEEARMAAKRSAMDRRDPYPSGHDERKRPTLGERRMEAPPPPRFDQVSSGVSGPSQSRSGAGGYGDSTDIMSKKRDYGGKRDDIRKGDSRGAGGDFKRGSDFDILPRHSSGSSGHMIHPNHTSSHQGNLIKYPGQNYDDRGRDNSDIGGPRQDSGSGGPLQSSRSKDTNRYADRAADRSAERGSGMSYRGGGGDRDNGRRAVEASDHRPTSGSKMPPRGSSRERRYVDSGIKDSGRYNDRPNSSWHTGGASSSSKPYGSGGMSSNTGSGMNSGQNMVSNNPWANDSRSKPSQNQSSAWRQVDNTSSNDRYEERYVSIYKQSHPVGGLASKGNAPVNTFTREYLSKTMPQARNNNVQRQVSAYQKSSYY